VKVIFDSSCEFLCPHLPIGSESANEGLPRPLGVEPQPKNPIHPRSSDQTFHLQARASAEALLAAGSAGKYRRIGLAMKGAL
jgi:hypothetical protein